MLKIWRKYNMDKYNMTNHSGHATKSLYNKTEGEYNMNLEEAIEFLNNQGYYLKETHAEDDELDYRCDIVYTEVQKELTGGTIEMNWKNGTAYSRGVLYTKYISNDGESSDIQVTFNDNHVKFITIDGQDMTEEEFIEMANSGEI